MNAQTKCNVPIHFAVDDHGVGVLEHVWVAVGGGERKQNRVALFHWAATDFCILADNASHGYRCVCAQQLFNRGWQQLGFGNHAGQVGWVMR